MRTGSQDELLALRDEVMRLGGLLERAITALQHTGAEKSADRLERELDVPVETHREATADISAILCADWVKTDARDAFIIADAARLLRQVDVGDETLAELDVLVRFDDDLAGEATRIGNRIRGLLTGIHPALERARRSPTWRSSRSCLIAAVQLGSARLVDANWPRSPPNTRPGWTRSWSRRC